MDFYTANGLKRPVRLNETTRRFAYESLNHKYGIDTRKNDCVVLDDVENIENMTALERYDEAIAKIASEAPIRICEDERISGAATLGAAIRHVVPAKINGNYICGSISHLTVDFEGVLKYGIDGIRKKAEEALEKYTGTEREAFAKSCINCLDSFEVWHERYLEALKGKSEYAANYRNLQRVPMRPATNFYEAVQSIWFTFAFLRLCGNWPGIGRIDVLLGDYLENDMKSGKLTLDEAREILAHFFIKGCEWICGGNYGSGDAQHYQNIVLCGIDENCNEVTNDVTYLVLDVLEELGISDFPTSVRLNRNTDEKLLERVAEVMRYGGGMLAVYDEETIIESMVNYGYPLDEARNFANDGCWEVQVPGTTDFGYFPFDALSILQKKTLKSYDGTAEFGDFESLYKQYIHDLKDKIKQMCQPYVDAFNTPGASAEPWHSPCTVVSLFERGCIEKGLPYLDGGPKYRVRSPHIGGFADTVNSLFAIKKVVYDEKKLTLSEFLQILKNNWDGEEPLRLYMLNHYSYYGSDSDEVDMLAARLMEDFADCCAEFDGKCDYNFPAGVSTFGRQIEWAPGRLAAPHGRKSGEVLAGNCSPTPGTDLNGATGIIRSYCKCKLKRMVTGAALDVKLIPSNVMGEDGLQALVALMRGFVNLGGCFMQLDVVDSALLKEAQEHPENYSTLSVRVSGWNARFVTLNKEWQDMIISQNEGK